MSRASKLGCLDTTGGGGVIGNIGRCRFAFQTSSLNAARSIEGKLLHGVIGSEGDIGVSSGTSCNVIIILILFRKFEFPKSAMQVVDFVVY